MIDDNSENDFVLTLDADGSIWIGLSDHGAEATFRWVSGAAAGGGYENWQVLQPNDLGMEEDCAEVNPGGVWNDLTCATSETYVCECDGAALPAMPTWCRTGLDTSCDTCGDNCTASGFTCQLMQLCLP